MAPKQSKSVNATFILLLETDTGKGSRKMLELYNWSLLSYHKETEVQTYLNG